MYSTLHTTQATSVVPRSMQISISVCDPRLLHEKMMTVNESTDTFSNSSTGCIKEWPELRFCSGQGRCILNSKSNPQCDCTSPWSGKGDFFDLELVDCGCHQVLLKVFWAVALALAISVLVQAVYRIRAGMLLRNSAKVDTEPSTRTSSAESSPASSATSPEPQRRPRRKSTSTRYKTIWGEQYLFFVSASSARARVCLPLSPTRADNPYSYVHVAAGLAGFAYAILAALHVFADMFIGGENFVPSLLWLLASTSWYAIIGERTVVGIKYLFVYSCYIQPMLTV